MRFKTTFLPVSVMLVAVSAAFGQDANQPSPKMFAVEVVIVETGAPDTALPATDNGDELLKAIAAPGEGGEDCDDFQDSHVGAPGATGNDSIGTT